MHVQPEQLFSDVMISSTDDLTEAPGVPIANKYREGKLKQNSAERVKREP